MGPEQAHEEDTVTDSTGTAATRRDGLVRDPARLRARLLALVGAGVAGVAVWVVAVPLAGADLIVTTQGRTQEILLALVAVSSVLQPAVGWGVLAIMERFWSRARTGWLVLAVLVLVVTGFNAVNAAENTATAVWLNVMHVAVAAAFVPVLARTSPRR